MKNVSADNEARKQLVVKRMTAELDELKRDIFTVGGVDTAIASAFEIATKEELIKCFGFSSEVTPELVDVYASCLHPLEAMYDNYLSSSFNAVDFEPFLRDVTVHEIYPTDLAPADEQELSM